MFATPPRLIPRARVLCAAVLVALLALTAGAREAGAVPLTSTAAATISSSNATPGVAKVGDVLTCGSGSWSVEPSGRSWWWRRGSEFSLNTASTYTVAAADVGSSITCSVTGTLPGESATSADSPAVSIPAAAAVTLGTPQKDGVPTNGAIGSAGAWTLPWTITGGTLAGCAINGAPVACSGSALTFDPASVTNGSTVTFAVTAANAAGATVTTSTTFRVAVPPRLVVATPTDQTLAPGDLVALEIETDADARVTCAVNGAPVVCTRTRVWFPLSLPTAQQPSDIVEVTATNAGGTTTVTRRAGPTGFKRQWRFPTPITAQTGTTLTVFSDLDFHFWASVNPSVQYRFTGAIPDITWTAIEKTGTFSLGTAIRVPVPSTPGTKTAELRWGNGGFSLVDKLVVRAVDPDEIAEDQFGGIGSGKALKCPGKGPYQWYANDVLQLQTDVPYLPTGTDVFDHAAVSCASVQWGSGVPLMTHGIVAEGAIATAIIRGPLVEILISRPSKATVSLSTYGTAIGSAKGAPSPKRLATLNVKLKKGRNTVRLPASAVRKLGKRRFSVGLQLVGRKGRRSPTLTLKSR